MKSNRIYDPNVRASLNSGVRSIQDRKQRLEYEESKQQTRVAVQFKSASDFLREAEA